MRERVFYLSPTWTFYGGIAFKVVLGAQSMICYPIREKEDDNCMPVIKVHRTIRSYL